MPKYDAYLLRIWRSTGTHGRQFAGRVEHLGKGEIARFSDLPSLLEHIRLVAEAESTSGAGLREQESGRDPANP